MKEITFADYAGSYPLYAVAFRLSDGLYVNGAALEAYNASHWQQYAITLTLSNGVYSADFPQAPNGQYVVAIYEQRSFTPTDTKLATDDIVWLPLPSASTPTTSANGFAADAALMVAEMGEEITYTPANGTPRTLNAIVTRNGYRTAEGQVQADDITVSLLNDAEQGITSVVINRDEISLAPVWGTGATSHLITQVVTADAGLITVRLG